jgi:phosphate uptake regulator
MSDLLKKILEEELQADYISALSETAEVVCNKSTVEGAQDAYGILSTLLLAAINSDAERCLELAKQLNEVNREYFATYTWLGRNQDTTHDPANDKYHRED